MSRKLFMITALLLTLVTAVPAVAQPDTGTDPAPALAQNQPPKAFVTIDFSAGVPLDPFILSLQGGGPVDAATLDKACTGWMPTEPSVAFNYAGKTPVDRVKFFVFSDHDPVLVVKTPDGKYSCNDNTNPLLLDPTVTIDKPQPGTYSVWVGNRLKRGLIAGMLVITTKPGVDLGTFKPGELVKRANIPETLPTPKQDPGNAERAKQALAQVAARAPVVKAGDPDTTVTFVADGTFSPITYLGGDLQCNGLIKLEATYVFSVTGAIKNLRLFAEGSDDSNLIIRPPAGDAAHLCNDDAAQDNFNPMVDIANPAPGIYAVWVGRVDAGKPLTGTLTITQSDEQPKVLTDH